MILHADDWLVIADKPSGLLSVPGRGEDKQDCLLHRLRDRFPELRVVHRLDRDTSGLIVFARSLAVQRELGRQFESRVVEKTYHAVVDGIVATDQGRIEVPLRKDLAFRDPPKYCVDWEHGRPAITDWRVLERFADRTRLALYPRTGRSHQLRLHLAHIGHPITGDAIYGTPGERLMLHAAELTFAHPGTGERATFASVQSF